MPPEDDAGPDVLRSDPGTFSNVLHYVERLRKKGRAQCCSYCISNPVKRLQLPGFAAHPSLLNLACKHFHCSISDSALVPSRRTFQGANCVHATLPFCLPAFAATFSRQRNDCSRFGDNAAAHGGSKHIRALGLDPSLAPKPQPQCLQRQR